MDRRARRRKQTSFPNSKNLHTNTEPISGERQKERKRILVLLGLEAEVLRLQIELLEILQRKAPEEGEGDGQECEGEQGGEPQDV